MNKVLLSGRLTDNVKLVNYGKGDNAGVLAGFSIATQGANKDDTVFIQCTAFNGQAEFLEKWFKKGSPVEIEGRLQNDTYEDAKGTMHYTYKVMVERVAFTVSNKPEDPEQTNNKPNKYRR